EAARRMQCSNQMKQIALAMHNYHDVHNQLPYSDSEIDNPRREKNWTWSILPFMEQTAVYEQLDLSLPIYVAPNWPIAHTMVFDGFICPSDPIGGDALVEDHFAPGWEITQ